MAIVRNEKTVRVGCRISYTQSFLQPENESGVLYTGIVLAHQDEMVWRVRPEQTIPFVLSEWYTPAGTVRVDYMAIQEVLS